MPGSEQTLRNYIHFLKTKGLVKLKEPSFREIDYVDEEAIPYGEQAQLDYGQELLEDASIVHFIALELRRSRDKGVQGFSFRARTESLCLSCSGSPN